MFRIEKPERRKPVRSFGGRYSVGSNGNVYNRDGEQLKAVDGRWVNLSQEGQVERMSIAYLVARAFLPNTEGRPYVRHKDGDIRNNRLDNLEWSETADERKKSRGRYARWRVGMFDREGVMVRIYGSAEDAAADTGINANSIRLVCRGDRRHAGGFIWRWVE